MKFGQQPMQMFDKRFDPCSYFWWGPKSIHLSLIMVKSKHRGQGVTSKMLETVKRYNRKVVIPCPSNSVIRLARKKGYRMGKELARHGRFTEEIEVMVWTPKKK